MNTWAHLLPLTYGYYIYLHGNFDKNEEKTGRKDLQLNT